MSEQDNIYDNSQDGNNSTDYAGWEIAITSIVGIFASTMSIVAMFFIFAIFKDTRKFTFNLYVVFILVPDCLMNLVEGVRCFYELSNSGSIPSELCYVRNFMVLFYYYSNLTVNAFIAKEVYSLVWNSYRRVRRIRPPTNKTVWIQVTISYSVGVLMAIWYIAPVSWSPITVTLTPYCRTSFGSEEGYFNATYGLVVAMATSLPMIAYVFWRGFQIWYKNILPLKGRTRALGLYFIRIVVTFFAFYVPMLCIAMVKNYVPIDQETRYFVLNSIFSIVIASQNIVTIKFLMQKDDISKAVHGYLSRIFSSNIFRASQVAEQSEWFMEDAYENSRPESDVTIPTERGDDLSPSAKGCVNDQSATDQRMETNHKMEENIEAASN